ncbi:MAG: T9SS type A sorting domain-containing protein [Chitinophagales bacterium]
MKKRIYLLFGSCLIILFTALILKEKALDTAIEATHTHFENKEAAIHFPYDNFYFQRTYPDFTFDWKAYTNVLQKAKKQAGIQLQQKDNVGFTTAWSLEGPGNIGGRINVVIADPNNSNILYVGAAKGGVFKSIDAGENWFPIFDEQLFLSIGAIAVDPNDSNIVYVGTGDLNISGNFSVGDGLYKSEDGGNTWTHLGLVEERIVSKILIHPNNSNILYASCMGNPLERNTKRGVYQSKDGGETWKQVLFVAEDAGVIDMVMNWENPDIIYAAAWNRIRTNQESVTSGDDAKIFRTMDGGDTWIALTEGLPTANMSRIGLAISPTNPNVIVSVYVNTSHELHGIFKTTDQGETWNTVPTFEGFGLPNNPLGGFGWYFAKIGISPQSDDDIFLLGVDLHRTKDGGNIWNRPISEANEVSVHADKHSLFFVDESTFLLATDGGLYRSSDNGLSWQDIENIPITQFYRVANNPHNDTYWGGAQDNGTIHGNSLSMNEWERAFGGDGFQVVFHPENENIVWAETQYGKMIVSNDGGHNFFPAINGIDFNNDRVNWDMPFIMSAHNPDVLYAGTYRLYKNTQGIQADWQPISNDLTDGIIFGPNFHTITTIAESPIDSDHLYVGTSDANVWRTLDGGDTWENVTHNLPERYVTSIKTSLHQPNILYVTHSGFKGNGFIPHIHRSMDYGDTWQDISSDLPPIGVNDILTLPEDTAEVFLFAGTDAGVYASLNAGENWQRLGSNMPYGFVFDMDYDPVHNQLIAGTYSRSMYSFPLDSIIEYNLLTDIADTGLPNKKDDELQIKPNPATSFIEATLEETSSSLSTQYEWRIYTIEGKQVLLQNSLKSNIHLDISQLPSDIYLLQVTCHNKRSVKRFVKE